MKKFTWPLSFLLFLGACNSGPAVRPTSKQPELSRPMVPYTADPPVDKSGMDMSYFPPDYPQLKMAGKATGEPVMRIIYSRPHKDGRDIFGDVVRYGNPWRLGANEATEIEFFQPVIIQQKKVPKGRYVLYAIPGAETWQLILNGYLYTWGLKIDRKKDLFTFTIPSRKLAVAMDIFSMQFGKTATGAELTIAWDKTMLALPIEF